MEDIRTVHLKIRRGRLSEIAWEVTQVRFLPPGPRPPWEPRINLYRHRDGFTACVDLAGVERADISLRAEPRRLQLSGWRAPPMPAGAGNPLRQILVWEIDDGRCERDIPLPAEIDPAGVLAEQRNGLLWIELPLRFPE